MGTRRLPRNAELEEFYINVTRDAALRDRPDYSSAQCRAGKKFLEYQFYEAGTSADLTQFQRVPLPIYEASFILVSGIVFIRPSFVI